MRLRRSLSIVPGPPLHLRAGDREMFLFDGATEPWLIRLLRALDGRERREIGLELADVPSAEVDRALRKLAEAGVLETEPPPRRTARIALHGQSPLWPRLREVLDAEFCGQGELSVVHEEVHAPSEIAAINRRHLSERRPWLLLSLQGAWARIGPLFVPGETCCWECYRARLRSNRANPEAHRAWEREDRALASPALPRHQAAVASLAAGELARFLFGESPPRLTGRVLVLDLETLESAVEAVWIAPYCPACRA